MNTNDLRGKVLRIKVNDDGSYTIPAGNLFAPGTARTRPEIYAMGFRNPFRIQVDENDVAYVTDYSPDSSPAARSAARPARAAWRSSASPPTTAGRCAMTPTSRTTSGTSTPSRRSTTRRSRTSATTRPRGRTTPRGGTRASTSGSTPADHATRTSGTRTRTTDPPAGTPCFATYDRPARPARARSSSRSSATGGVGPHGAATYDYDPDNPSETKFPPYYDGAIVFGEFTQDTMREVRFDSAEPDPQDQPVPELRSGASSRPRSRSSATTRWTCSSGPTATSTCSPTATASSTPNADAGMYRWEYKKGPRAPHAVRQRHADERAGAADGAVLAARARATTDPGDSITFAWDFDDQRQRRLDRPEPESHVHHRRASTRPG